MKLMTDSPRGIFPSISKWPRHPKNNEFLWNSLKPWPKPMLLMGWFVDVVEPTSPYSNGMVGSNVTRCFIEKEDGRPWKLRATFKNNFETAPGMKDLAFNTTLPTTPSAK